MRVKGRGTFRALANRNFRVYCIGQLASMAGSFMQTVAQAWLVLTLTGSGTALGLLATLQFLPPLLFSFFFGALADRVDRRKLFVLTEVLAGILALVLGILTATGVVELWMVLALAFVTGIVVAMETPVRHSFTFDMVGPAEAGNAISLSMSLVNISRVVGPALAGVTISLLGVAPCFFVNAASYGAVILSLLLVRAADLHPVAPHVEAEGGLVRGGLRYLREHREVLAIFAYCCLFFALAWEFEVVFPLVAKFTFSSGAGIYGLMTSAIGVGAVAATLVLAGARAPTNTTLVIATFIASVAYFLAAIAPWLWAEIAVLPLVGAGVISLAWVCNTRLQLGVSDSMRGRVMALWTMSSLGTRPIAAPFVGYVGTQLGPRAAVMLGAIGPLLGLFVWYVIRVSGRGSGEPEPQPVIVSVAP
jgi:MFS family permease